MVFQEPHAGTDRERAVAAVRELLIATGENPDRRGLLRTPQRVADLFLDLFSGLRTDAADALGQPIPIAVGSGGDLVEIEAVPFRSTCEHHLLPFYGTVDISYAPRGHLVGLSRVVSLISVASRRPQLQERLGRELAEVVMAVLEPHGVTVRIEAAHGCMAHLEPQAASARVITVASLGSLTERGA